MQCNLCTRTALLAAVLAAAGQAQAAGGAHVIDDSEVGAPGSCQVDTWAALQEHHQKQISLAPACTPAALPWLELGANLGHDWRGSRHESRVGPALKLSLLPPDHGLGLGLKSEAGMDARTGRWTTAGWIVPVTLPIRPWLRLNLNAGWTLDKDDESRRHAAFYGLQVEADLAAQVSLMAEAFQRKGSRSGYQAGARWNPGNGPLDLDLLVGRRVDGSDARQVTLGMSVRF